MLYDFDPLRVRKEQLDRLHKLPPSPTTTSSSDSPPTKRRTLLPRLRSSSSSTSPTQSRGTLSVDGDIDGVTLVTAETVLPGYIPLMGEIRTGRDFPYMLVKRATTADVALIDGERIVEVGVSFYLRNKRSVSYAWFCEMSGWH